MTNSKKVEAFESKGEHVGYLVDCPGCGFLHAIYIKNFMEKGNPTWKFNGDIENPTFSPSLLVYIGDERRCHSFIRNGKWQFLKDCTHDLAGKIVDMVPVDDD